MGNTDCPYDDGSGATLWGWIKAMTFCFVVTPIAFVFCGPLSMFVKIDIDQGIKMISWFVTTIILLFAVLSLL
jgi:hypothetical protein